MKVWVRRVVYIVLYSSYALSIALLVYTSPIFSTHFSQIISQTSDPISSLATTTANLDITPPDQTQDQNNSQDLQITNAQQADAHVATPNAISIPALKINAPVLAMGLTNDGKMAVPNDFKNVGWYKFGARPGQIGSAVMGAHVDNGGSVAGVFKNLKYIKAGEDVYTTDSDGNTQHFKVVATKVYKYTTLSTQQVFSQSDTARLNIITCYGTWLPNVKTYDRRLVVFTKLVS